MDFVTEVTVGLYNLCFFFCAMCLCRIETMMLLIMLGGPNHVNHVIVLIVIWMWLPYNWLFVKV